MNSLVPPGTFALLILAISVVYGERVNLAIVSAWHLVLWTSLLYWQRYIVVSLPIDKCAYCKSLWIKGECKSLFWRPVHTETQSPVAVNKAFENQLPPLGFSHTYFLCRRKDRRNQKDLATQMTSWPRFTHGDGCFTHVDGARDRLTIACGSRCQV